MTRLFLVTSNPFKRDEIEPLCSPLGFTLEHYSHKIEELQSVNADDIVRDKARKAFDVVRQPVLVDHSGLALNALSGFPGGLTQIFWDILQGRICDLVSALGDKTATALVSVAYCDGKTIVTQTGSKAGAISDTPRGARDFQWDKIFVPEGETRTYAEMTVIEKNAISQRASAVTALLSRIRGA